MNANDVAVALLLVGGTATIVGSVFAMFGMAAGICAIGVVMLTIGLRM